MTIRPPPGVPGLVVSSGAFDALIPGNNPRRKDVSLPKLTYTVTEAAELLGISRTSAYDCVRRGELPALALGRRIVIPRTELERLLGPIPHPDPTGAVDCEQPCYPPRPRPRRPGRRLYRNRRNESHRLAGCASATS